MTTWGRAAACFAASLSFAAQGFAQSTSSWATAQDGNYTDATRWNPLGVPDGASVTARIDATGSPYDVLLANQSIQLDRLILDSPGATFRLFPTATLNLNSGVSINAGSFSLWGGTFRGSINGVAGTIVTAPSGDVTLSATTLGVPLVASVRVLINGLTLTNNSSITLGGNFGRIQANSAQTIGGAGDIIFANASSEITALGAGTGALTIGSGITVRSTLNNVGTFSGNISNHGTISARDMGRISIPGTFTNFGRLESNGTALSSLDVSVSQSFSNQGLIVSNGGRVNVGGSSYQRSQLGTVQINNGGTLTFSGTVNNASQTFAAGDYNNRWELGSGTLSGGVIVGPAPARARGSFAQQAVFNHVNLQTDLVIQNGYAQLINGSTMNGHVITVTDNAGVMFANQTTTDASEIVLNGGSATGASGFEFPATLSIHGSGGVAGPVNHAAITVAPNKAMNIPGNWINDGTINLGDGTLRLLGSVINPSALGHLNRTGGVITTNGTLALGGGSLDLDQLGGGLDIAGGTISNGMVIGSGSLTAFQDSIFTALELVRLAAPMYVGSAATVNVYGSLDLLNADVLFDNLAGISSDKIQFRGSVGLNGSGNIKFNTGLGGGGGAVKHFGPGGLLTIAPGISITAEGCYLEVTGTNGGAILNQGTIRVLNGGTLALTDLSTIRNYAAGALNGGTWIIGDNSTAAMGPATITLNNAAVVLDGASASFPAIASMQTNQGRFLLRDGGRFVSAGTLNNSGTLSIESGSAVVVKNALANTGTVDVNATLMIDPPALPAPYAQIASQIAQARNGGDWLGQGGITSTAARDSSPRVRTVGLLTGQQYRSIPGNPSQIAGTLVRNQAVIARATLYGDADLSEFITFDDYARIDAGFNNAGTTWFAGDFDLNGAINFDDYALIDLAFNWQMLTLPRAINWLNGGDRSDGGMDEPALRMVQAHFAQFGEPYARSFLAAVPEPTQLFVLTIAFGLSRRRSRQEQFKFLAAQG